MSYRRVRSFAVLLTTALLSVTGLAPASALVDPGSGYSYETTSVVVPMTFPIATSHPTSYSDHFLACRSGCSRMHMGQDLMGAKMSPVLAAFDGTITSLRRETSTSGGNYLIITADRGPAAGWSAIYVHVNNDTPGTDDGRGTTAHAFAPGVEVGTRVLEGQLIAWRGDSGNAENTAPHIHFELRKTTPEGKSGWGGTVYNAYPSLQEARRLAAPLPSGPHPEGSLLRSPAGSLWVVHEGKRRFVDALDLAADGRSPQHAIPVSDAEIRYYPLGEPWPLRAGTIARDPEGGVWLLTGSTRSRITLAQLHTLGISDPRVHAVSAAALNRVVESALPANVLQEAPRYTPIVWGGMRTRLAPPDSARLVPGTLVRQRGSAQVFLVDRYERLRWVPDQQVLASHGWSIRDVAVRGSLTGRASWIDVPLREGTLVEATSDRRVGVPAAGAFRVIRNAAQLQSYGYTHVPRLQVAPTHLEGLRLGEFAGR